MCDYSYLASSSCVHVLNKPWQVEFRVLDEGHVRSEGLLLNSQLQGRNKIMLGTTRGMTASCFCMEGGT